MPNEHLCAYLLAPGKIELRRVPVPEPGPGELLVRLEAALAGGTDRKAFGRGHPQIPMPGPFGHRYSGTVAALGREAPPFSIGEPIMGVHSAPCQACRLCRTRREQLCPDVMKEKVLGAFAQYLLVPPAVARQNLFTRPSHLSAEHAALLEPLACVVHGLKSIEWRGVERVLILGLGSIGLLFVQLLRRYTQAERVAAGRRAERLALARRFGANAVWDVAAPGPGSNEFFDCVLECTGQLEGWQEAVRRAAPGGQVLLFGGLPRGTAFAVDSYRLHYEELRLLGDFHFAPRDVAEAREHLLAGGLDLDPLISGRLPLSQLREALQRLERGEGMQYAIDPTH
jgi:L-iditol 2-dehydrogenase